MRTIIYIFQLHLISIEFRSLQHMTSEEFKRKSEEIIVRVQ